MLHVHRSERADRLADGLAETLKDPLNDPFAPDVVAVPTRGIERWLIQRLSTALGASPDRNDGVCANIEFPFPGRLIVATLAQATGIDPAPRPMAAGAIGLAAYPARRRVHKRALARDAEGAPRGSAAGGRRSDPAVRGHAAHRRPLRPLRRSSAGMIRNWAAGDDSSAGEASWQPELWRRLKARLNEPSPAERMDTATAAIREDPGILELPLRLARFGLTRIPRSYLEVLAAIAHERDVHLFVLHPSPALWRQIASQATGPPRATAPTTRRDQDPTADIPANRLLASWGRDARELQLVLSESEAQTTDHHHELKDPATDTLLRHIQAAIRQTSHRQASRSQTRRTSDRPSPQQTEASRSTPATVARGRSRFSETRSFICSRKTRRSSRGTSS